MSKTPTFYNNRVCLNVLAGSLENAKDCYNAAKKHVVIGLLSKNYENNRDAVEDMTKYKDLIENAISVGLGAGDPNQSQMVSEISKELQPQHVNQVFTGAGATRALLNQDESFVNGLVSPTGKVGYVNIATGPESSDGEIAEVPIETAILLLKDMGASSLKFYPMNGLEHVDEYKTVAKACAKHEFNLEPTGGINLENFGEIVQIALDAGVRKIIPHVYSSIIDSETGDTKVDDVKELYRIMENLDYD
jgi:uncharacterized protein (TIGR03581 family)